MTLDRSLLSLTSYLIGIIYFTTHFEVKIDNNITFNKYLCRKYPNKYNQTDIIIIHKSFKTICSVTIFN